MTAAVSAVSGEVEPAVPVVVRRLSAGALAVVLGVAGLVASLPARAAGSTTDPVDKVTICHRTHALTNPYVLITVSVSSVVSTPKNSNGHDTHDSDKQHNNKGAGTGPFPGIYDGKNNNTKFWGDIIPPFYYVDQGSTRGDVKFYPGLNWSKKWLAPTYEVQNNQKWITDGTFADALVFSNPNDKFDTAVQYCIDKKNRTAAAAAKQVASSDALYKLETKGGGNPKEVKAEILALSQEAVDKTGKPVFTDPTNFSETVVPDVMDKVTICHRTHAVTNPYVLITVSVSSVISTPKNSNGHDTHDSDKQHDNGGKGTGPFPGIWDGVKNNTKFWGDIIPPFSYLDGTEVKSYAGLNWSPTWKAPTFEVQNNQKWITDGTFADAIVYSSPQNAYDKAVALCVDKASRGASAQSKAIDSAEALYALETKNGRNPKDVKQEIKDAAPVDKSGKSKWVDPTNFSEVVPEPTIDKVTICHRTHAVTNPYRLITVSVNSVVSTKANSNGHDTHDSDKQHDNGGKGTGPFPGIYDGKNNNTKFWGDIIPPFTYLDGTTIKKYPGLNWSKNWAAPSFSIQNNQNWITNADFGAALKLTANDNFDKAVANCIGTDGTPAPQAKEIESAEKFYAKEIKEGGQKAKDVKDDIKGQGAVDPRGNKKDADPTNWVEPSETTGTPVDKVTMCHRTHAVSNPYVLITVSVSSVISTGNNSNGHDTHDSDSQHNNDGKGTGPFPGIYDGRNNNTKYWGDIIPPFYYEDSGKVKFYEGLNWSPNWKTPTYETQNNQKWITDATFADAIVYSSPLSKFDKASTYCIEKATKKAAPPAKEIEDPKKQAEKEQKEGVQPTVTPDPKDPTNTTNPTLTCSVDGMKITGSLNTTTNWKWWYFEWSTKESFRPTEKSPKMTSPTGGTVTAQTGTLLPGTTYYFRIVGGHDAVGSNGKTEEFTFWGNVEKCTIPGVPPSPEPTPTESVDEYEGLVDPEPTPTPTPTDEPTSEPTSEPTMPPATGPTPNPEVTTKPEVPVTIDPKDITPPPNQQWDPTKTKLIDPATGKPTDRVETEKVIVTVTPEGKIVVFPKQVNQDSTVPTTIDLRLTTKSGQTVTTQINVRNSRKSAKITLVTAQLAKTGESTADLQRNGLLLLLIGFLLMPLAAAPVRRRK